MAGFYNRSDLISFSSEVEFLYWRFANQTTDTDSLRAIMGYTTEGQLDISSPGSFVYRDGTDIAVESSGIWPAIEGVLLDEQFSLAVAKVGRRRDVLILADIKHNHDSSDALLFERPALPLCPSYMQLVGGMCAWLTGQKSWLEAQADCGPTGALVDLSRPRSRAVAQDWLRHNAVSSVHIGLSRVRNYSDAFIWAGGAVTREYAHVPSRSVPWRAGEPNIMSESCAVFGSDGQVNNVCCSSKEARGWCEHPPSIPVRLRL